MEETFEPVETLVDLPSDILISINYHLSPQDFLNMRTISKKSEKIYNSLNYFRKVEYERIKNVKNISCFKKIDINTLPEKSITEILDFITPLHVDIDLMWFNRDEVISIPNSVTDASLVCTGLYFDPTNNPKINILWLFDVKLIGKIPKTVKHLELVDMPYELEDPSTLKSLSVAYIPDYDYFIYTYLPPMINIEILAITLESQKEGYIYKIPDLPKLRKISINVNCSGIYTIDLGNNPKLKTLRLSSCSHIFIQNPPPNLEEYDLSIHTFRQSLWNKSLNISARKVILNSHEDFEYISDGRVETIILEGKVRSRKLISQKKT